MAVGMRLDGKVALISGGARGIGAAVARRFIAEGASVVIGDVLTEEGQRLAAEVQQSGGKIAFTPLEVTSEVSWTDAVALALDRYGKLDILVNNAGVIKRDLIEDETPKSWDRTMEVNAKGVFLGTKAVLSEMKRHGNGSIVNLSSSYALTATPHSAAYGASKTAVKLFTRSTAIQNAHLGVRANSVCPGPINAPLIQEYLEQPELLKTIVSRVPVGRLGEPEEVASAILFLASDESSFVTGSEVVIDGGITAQ